MLPKLSPCMPPSLSLVPSQSTYSTAFRDPQTAARNGFSSAWFLRGRDYENFNDHSHANSLRRQAQRRKLSTCVHLFYYYNFILSVCPPANGHSPSPRPTLPPPEPNPSSPTPPSHSNPRISNYALSEFTQLPPFPSSLAMHTNSQSRPFFDPLLSVQL